MKLQILVVGGEESRVRRSKENEAAFSAMGDIPNCIEVRQQLYPSFLTQDAVPLSILRKFPVDFFLQCGDASCIQGKRQS